MNLTDLTYQMEENNRSNYEIERHTRNARGHLLEIKKTAFATFDIQSQMLDVATLDIQSQILDSINSLVSLLKGNALADLEKDREMRKGKGAASIAAPEKFTVPEGAGLGSALGAAALGIGVAAGALLAWGKTIKAYFKLFTTADFRKSLAGVLDGWKTSIANLKSRMALKVTNIGVALATFFDDLKMKLTPSAEGPLAKIGARIAQFYTTITDTIFESWKGVGTRIGKIFTSIRTIITTTVMAPINLVKGFFTTIGTHVGKFGSLVGKIAGVAGRVLAPLGIIMVAWDTIMGAIDGFSEGSGIIDSLFLGLKGALDGFVTSLFTVPMDLIKDMVSWVLKKFNFDEASETLDSFSFTDLFLSLTQGIYDFLDGLVDSIVGVFTKGIDIVSNFSMKDFFIDILRRILPKADPDKPWYKSLSGITSKVIPEGIYNYAGLNKETGLNTAEYDLAQASSVGAEMAEDKAAKETAGFDRGFAGQAAINSGNTTDNSTTQVTVHTQMPSAQSNAAGNQGDLNRKRAR